jgi:hypothetical protein
MQSAAARAAATDQHFVTDATRIALGYFAHPSPLKRSVVPNHPTPQGSHAAREASHRLWRRVRILSLGGRQSHERRLAPPENPLEAVTDGRSPAARMERIASGRSRADRRCRARGCRANSAERNIQCVDVVQACAARARQPESAARADGKRARSRASDAARQCARAPARVTSLGSASLTRPQMATVIAGDSGTQRLTGLRERKAKRLV